MTDHQTTDQPWDDQQLRARILAALRAQPRLPLLEAAAHRDLTTPAAYALFLSVADHRRVAAPFDDPRPQLGAFGAVVLDGCVPAYAGAAAALRERLLRHVNTLRRAVGLGPEDLWVSYLTGSHALALYAEAVILSELRPILCDPHLSGFGSRQPGRGRPGRPGRVSGWDALMSSGRWGREPTMAEHARALLEVAVRVSEPGAFALRWEPIEPGRAA